MTAGGRKLVSYRDESPYWITNIQTTKVDSADYIYAFVNIYASYTYVHICMYVIIMTRKEGINLRAEVISRG